MSTFALFVILAAASLCGIIGIVLCLLKDYENGLVFIAVFVAVWAGFLLIK